MMSFGEIEGLKDKVKIVINRVGLDAAQISSKKAQETIGREIFWELPNDYRTMSEVRNNGVPLIEQAPKAAITQSIVELAVHFTSGGSAPKDTADTEDGAKRDKTPRWRNLFSGKK
jgi:pilus assembly protein CpaE